ncbi:MAG: tetratricopeptide repeat protein [Planctomycetia bacterium]|nr:MAG: tetratricopeptide repeat protein [Planctomycetia bacterium]
MSRLEQLRKLAMLEPSDPLTHYGLGIEYLNLQRYDEAVAAFDAALAADPRYSTAFYHKARAQAGASRPDEARRTLEAGMVVAREAGDWHAEGEMRGLLESLA